MRSSGFFRNAVEIAPSVCRFEDAAVAICMIVGSIETALMKKRGFQPSWFENENDWIVNFGVAKTISTEAFEAFRRAIWERTWGR